MTPRVFYWPFLVWIYYDFYRHSEVEKVSADAFSDYLKRQDYFFVMANLLVDGSDKNGLVEKQQTAIDIDNNKNGLYKYNPSYFKSRYGGMQYYNAGFVVNVQGITGKKTSYFSYPYSKILYFGIETAGVLDIDSEIIFAFSNGAKLQCDFKSRVDIRKISTMVSEYIL